ncbi:hypothetical protein EVAR_27583_1 [Eumeta japonica]|uniref:Uncharacterized protein n=1 Tax=Eumeta variegata TaxID=151549 RepID=A0A4C1W9W9_EUMVA|nr:hypothetical protein EVAR_27583_1 [Eumeta japonica]
MKCEKKVWQTKRVCGGKSAPMSPIIELVPEVATAAARAPARFLPQCRRPARARALRYPFLWSGQRGRARAPPGKRSLTA